MVVSAIKIIWERRSEKIVEKNKKMALKQAITHLEVIQKTSSLSAVYNKVPSGSCSGCTNCCSESVNISFLEFANIMKNGVDLLTDEEKNDLNQRVMAFYILQWVKPMKCPFLDGNNRCLIYAVRPLPCRLFGTLRQKDYEANYTRIQQQNIGVATSIQSHYGLKMPKSVVRRKIDFCESFIPDQLLTENKVDALYSQLINLDSQLFFKGVMDENWLNGDLVDYYLTVLLEGHSHINKDMLFDLKVACLQSIQK